MDDARRFNMDATALAQLREALRSADIEEDQDGVWPEHWSIVSAFLAVTSQWRVVSIGGGLGPALPLFLGLDYSAVKIALDAEGIDITTDLWRGLRVMEVAACAALNEVKA